MIAVSSVSSHQVTILYTSRSSFNLWRPTFRSALGIDYSRSSVRFLKYDRSKRRFLVVCVCEREREREREYKVDALRYITYIRHDKIKSSEKINVHGAVRCYTFNVTSRCFLTTSHITVYLLIFKLTIKAISTQSHKFLHHLPFLF